MENRTEAGSCRPMKRTKGHCKETRRRILEHNVFLHGSIGCSFLPFQRTGVFRNSWHGILPPYATCIHTDIHPRKSTVADDRGMSVGRIYRPAPGILCHLKKEKKKQNVFREDSIYCEIYLLPAEQFCRSQFWRQCWKILERSPFEHSAHGSETIIQPNKIRKFLMRKQQFRLKTIIYLPCAGRLTDVSSPNSLDFSLLHQ